MAKSASSEWWQIPDMLHSSPSPPATFFPPVSKWLEARKAAEQQITASHRQFTHSSVFKAGHSRAGNGAANVSWKRRNHSLVIFFLFSRPNSANGKSWSQLDEEFCCTALFFILNSYIATSLRNEAITKHHNHLRCTLSVSSHLNMINASVL